ncbi:hypothetical protein C1S70_18695 (plasmid) [Azospirillum argentinense]|uniref:Uncharacterized protein n=1 Tax=Azospirillum argentinense TaxID=2970906 RepID=A0A2K1FXU5_9PROT|nr:hypothetical protein C1S70_18695 [Azospirillum argentinense]
MVCRARPPPCAAPPRTPRSPPTCGHRTSCAFSWLERLGHSPLPSGERVARRAGEGVARDGASGKSATPSP